MSEFCRQIHSLTCLPVLTCSENICPANQSYLTTHNLLIIRTWSTFLPFAVPSAADDSTSITPRRSVAVNDSSEIPSSPPSGPQPRKSSLKTAFRAEDVLKSFENGGFSIEEATGVPDAEEDTPPDDSGRRKSVVTFNDNLQIINISIN